MPNSIKERVTEDLNKAKNEGKLRSENIREIVKNAVSQAIAELQEGSSEIRTLVKDAVSTVIDNLQTKGQEAKEEITASIEGAIEAASSKRREALSQTQKEVEKLEAQMEREEKELEAEVDTYLNDIKDSSQDKASEIKTSLESAIETVKDSEEVALLQKRYAQLKAQLAIIRANLAARYGERYPEVQKYLDEVKTWYNQTENKPEVVAETVKQKRVEFESKLGEAGSALAKKEKRVKQLLKDLWNSAKEAFQDNKPHKPEI
ncbi:MAG: histidine kinase [Oscillatoria sp. PMC 1051.18]|uniref:histidine kinase n=1 Tax=Oscillatoria salina TaxID=331517 RepID=UPI0013BD4802|nr:histidine kinase [Oscillatoria salina]MBZ8178658.1 histidine kinase [Oscillatoria salina IIICB1]MEC4893608.1 histidine kinase [Oscillatoria sp. PMC 1050.18]MEC5031325.1 histidine kinase [Oscillatoria sp. PMC 1051.18]NET87296.1 histidine kinase [Kamptonema sp. SIO1D9]